MKIITEIFPNVADFQKYAPGISGQQDFTNLRSSAMSAKKHITDTITSEIWDLIAAAIHSDALESLKMAYSNLIMHHAVVFNVVSLRLSGTADVYKSEMETMRRQYIDNYFNGMDSLIKILSESDTYKTQWRETENHKIIDQLELKTTREFNHFYGIDMSYLFFFRCMPLQREALVVDKLGDTFKKAKGNDDLTELLRFALAKTVVSMALVRFDIITFPPTIRSLFDEQKVSRSGSDEKDRARILAEELRAAAMASIESVELALSAPDTSNVVSNTALNKEEDKFYFIP